MDTGEKPRWKKLVSLRSLPGLLLSEEAVSGGALFKSLWRLLENIHTSVWLLEGLRSAGSFLAKGLDRTPFGMNWSMLIIGLIWLSFVVWGDKIFAIWGGKPIITAEFIQTKMFPNHWVAPIAMNFMEAAGRPNEVFEFDILHEIYVVNQGKDITVKSLRAEAQFDGQTWIKLQHIKNLDDYELKTEKREPGKVGGEIIRKTYRGLDDFMVKTANGLNTRIGYRGFVRFQVNATKKQAEGEVLTKLWIIDALGNEHGSVLSKGDIEPSEGEITYSRKHLEI